MMADKSTDVRTGEIRVTRDGESQSVVIGAPAAKAGGQKNTTSEEAN